MRLFLRDNQYGLVILASLFLGGLFPHHQYTVLAVMVFVLGVLFLAEYVDRDHDRSFVRVTHDDDRVDDGDCDGGDYLSGDEWSAFLDTIDPNSGKHWNACDHCREPRCTGRPVYYVSHADDHHHYCTHHRPGVHRR